MATNNRTDYADLRQLLAENAADEVLFEAYTRLLVSWNCEGAAKGYLAAVGFICSRRPHMVGALLSLPKPPESDHAADALAVAICHASHTRPSHAFAPVAREGGVPLPVEAAG